MPIPTYPVLRKSSISSVTSLLCAVCRQYQPKCSLPQELRYSPVYRGNGAEPFTKFCCFGYFVVGNSNGVVYSVGSVCSIFEMSIFPTEQPVVSINDVSSVSKIVFSRYTSLYHPSSSRSTFVYSKTCNFSSGEEVA